MVPFQGTFVDFRGGNVLALVVKGPPTDDFARVGPEQLLSFFTCIGPVTCMGCTSFGRVLLFLDIFLMPRQGEKRVGQNSTVGWDPFDCRFFRGFLTKFLHRLDLNHPERLFEAFSCTTCDDFSEISGVRSVTLKAFFKT